MPSKPGLLQTYKYTRCTKRTLTQKEKLSSFLPNISITDPVLSSLAGRNPPNPVVAVTSGITVMELDPEIKFKVLVFVILEDILFETYPLVYQYEETY